MNTGNNNNINQEINELEKKIVLLEKKLEEEKKQDENVGKVVKVIQNLQ